MFDQHDRISDIDQSLDDVQQLLQIVKMQTGRRFVQQVHRASGVGPSQFGRQFHALGLSTGKRRRTLSQRHIVQSDIAQRLQDSANLGNVVKQLDGIGTGHLQHVVNGFAVVPNRQRLFVVASALAGLTRHPDVGQKVHFDTDLSIAKTLFAPSPGNIEAEPSGGVAANLRIGQMRKQLANRIKRTGIGRRIGRGRIPQRRLVNANHLVDMFEPANSLVGSRVFESIDANVARVH